MSPELEKLIEAARKIEMTPEQAEAQRRSFVYGNCAIENPLVTREMVDEAAERLARPSPAPDPSPDMCDPSDPAFTVCKPCSRVAPAPDEIEELARRLESKGLIVFTAAPKAATALREQAKRIEELERYKRETWFDADGAQKRIEELGAERDEARRRADFERESAEAQAEYKWAARDRVKAESAKVAALCHLTAEQAKRIEELEAELTRWQHVAQTAWDRLDAEGAERIKEFFAQETTP